MCGPVVERQGLSVCEWRSVNKGRLFTWRAGHGWAWRSSHPGEQPQGGLPTGLIKPHCAGQCQLCDERR